MAISEAAAELGSGGIAATGSLIAGILNYYATKATNKANREIFDISRQDTLAQQKEQNRQAKAALALQGRAQAFNEQEALYGRGERAEERGYGRMMGSYQRGADLLTQNMNLLQAKAAPFQKYAAGR